MKKALHFAFIAFTIGLLFSCKKDDGPVNPQQLPEGALSGEFSVSATRKVHFSQGNLWYGKVGSATTATWNFEANQYDFTPAGNGDWNPNHISHFFWSKNESVAYADSYNDQRTAENDIFFTNSDETTAKSDFTVNQESGKYRTLSTAEWRYLFAYTESGVNTDTKSPRYNHYKIGVTVCGKTDCLVLLPDGWQWDKNTVGADWQAGGYPEKQTGNEVTWKAMEDAGAVCLPAAGFRYDSDILNAGSNGYYWSSTASSSRNAYYLYFFSEEVVPDNFDPDYDDSFGRGVGNSVRLVTESK